MRNLVKLLVAGLLLASCVPPSEGGTAGAESSPGTTPDQGAAPGSGAPASLGYTNPCTNTGDDTPPQVVLTSPTPGAALSGTVTLTADATDNVGVTRVNFYLDDRLLLADTTPPFELVWDSATHGNGPGVFTARASDADCNWTTSAPVEVMIENTGNATYDATLKAPACSAVGSRCDSADLLEGRGLISPERNQPNTVGGSCADGSSGVSLIASLQRLVVSRADGTAFAAGKEVTVEASLLSTGSYASLFLDIFVSPDVSNPTWTLVDSRQPSASTGLWTHSTKYLLPAGGRHILRGVLRSEWGSTTPVPCIPPHYSGSYDDHDDLVISVGEETDATPPAVAITSPVEGATLERVITVGVAASDDFGVHRVELYDGATLIASSGHNPAGYSLSWATRTVPNGSHTLTARAYDLAGNVTTSVPVNVLIDNDYVVPQVALISPVEGATVNQTVSLEASASDDRGVVRVEFHVDGSLVGSRTAPPYTLSWNSRGKANGPHVLSATAYDAGGNASPPSTVNVLVDNDYSPPQTTLTSPASGETVSGTVSLEASASDDRGIAEVSFYVDYNFIGTATTPPYTISWDSTQVSNGSHNLVALAWDVGGNSKYSATVTVTLNNPGNARYDAALKVPRCDFVGTSCDTRELVRSRGTMSQGREPNTPNSLDTCADGSSGLYRHDESIERLRVLREDGTSLATGKRVRIEVDVYASSTSNNVVHLFYTANAKRSPTWTLLTSVHVPVVGFQTVSVEHILPAGSLQAVRAVLGAGSASTAGLCSPDTYHYTDRDDLVFPVGPQETDTVPPDQVVLTAPAPGAMVTGTLTLTASASDNLGVVAVDFYDGETLIGTDTQSPFSMSWNSRNGPNGSRTLTARARDLAGNVGLSEPVTVTAENDLTVPVVALTTPAPGSRLSRVVELAAEASDPEGVTRVDFYAGSRLIGSDSSAPFSCTCDTMINSSDHVSLSARAYDAAGNVGISPLVVVAIAAELVPPSVSLTAPGEGATLAGTVTLSADATDASGVSKVEFLLDGVLLATDTSAPYSFAWNTLTAANGGHVLSAHARDSYGNTATSTEVSVTVDNEAPAVALTSPVSGASVTGLSALHADATDNEGVTRVDFFVDGVLLASDTTAPYSVEWDSGLWFNTTHTLLAKAHDAAGNVGTSASLTVSTLQPGSAVYNNYQLYVPKCSTLSNVCDTTAYLKGRHTGESHAPNTIKQTCADGAGELEAQKINRIKVSSVDGTHFTQGGRVRLEVHVLALDTATDALDLFFASDANNPAWTYLTTLVPGGTGAQVLSTEHVLPGGKLQAVRAQFRVGGDSGSACSTGPRDDHDDVVFTVDSAPTVTLTAPSHDALVRGTVTLNATASDDQGVERVEFYVDGTLVGTDTSASYSVSWDSRGVADGAHTLTARAYDTGGLASTSTAVVVHTDNTAPDTVLTSPAQGSLLRGTILLEATLGDSHPITRVEFYDGASMIGWLSTAPYVLSWNTTYVTSGAHTLTVKAVDSAGNMGTSAGVEVTIDNTLPTVSISAPVSGALVGGTVQLSATASDASGVERVELYVDGALVGTDTSAPYAVSWDSRGVADGAHSLTARAYDIAGNVRTSTAVVVSTDNMAPDAVLTSPAQGSFLRTGHTLLEATASDTVGVAKVEFYDGTTLIGTTIAAPYVLTWYMAGVAEGAHTLTVKAHDIAGNVRTSAAVEVTVDRTAPVTALSAPAQNAHVRGTVPVSATASDNLGVERVELYADATLLGTATLAPYVVSWDTTGLANGSTVTLTSRAYDTAGNVTTSAGRTVTVDNTAPTVAITSPANGTSFSFLTFSTTLKASASDDSGVTQVVFYDGASVIGTDTTAPYSVSWSLLGVSKGWHTLTAKTYDAAGNVTTSAPISVKVN